MSRNRARILSPYTRRLPDRRHLVLKLLAIAAVLGFAMLMGFALGVFGTMVLQPFVAILGLLFLVAMWMADDTEPDLRPAAQTLFLVFLAFNTVWPSYIAIAIPGLPWITPARLLLGAMFFVFLLQVSQSQIVRDTIVGNIRNMKVTFLLWALFWGNALATVALSKSPGASLGQVLQTAVLWNLPALIALWLFVEGAFVRKAVFLLVGCSILLFVLTILEAMQRQPIWFGHIPSFLQVDGPLLQSIMNEQSRLDGSYRARGVFAVHLYFAQYLMIILPFLVHFLLSEQRFWHRMSVGALLVLMITVILVNNTRTGTTGMLIVIGATVGLFALRRFLRPRNKADMMAPAIFAGVAVTVMTVAALIAASPRLQTLTIGGAQNRGSDAVRGEQWARALSAIAKNPLGYGAGNSGPLAGRYAPGSGVWIIDSAWINLLVEYGILGMIAWAGMLVSLIVAGVLIYIRQHDDESELCGPAAVAIAATIMTMYSISFFGNITLLLIIGAMICGTAYRLRRGGVVLWPIVRDGPTVGPVVNVARA